MTRKIRRVRNAAICFLLAAVGLWFVPGMKFSACFCTGISAILVLWIVLDIWSKKSRNGRLCKAIFLTCIFVWMIAFTAIETLLVAHGETDHRDWPADAVIVLGAGVNGRTPSLALSTRIDAAEDYLHRHPNIPAVLSGGKGPGEDITEAEAMRTALVERGVDETRLILEEESTSTAENFAYSKIKLKAHGIDTETAKIAVISNDFHAFRAQLIAKRAGLDIFSVSAELPWIWLNMNYYTREAFALVKTALID